MHVQSDTVFLANLFSNFRNICLKTYGLHPAHFLPTSGLPGQEVLQMTKIKIDLLTNIDMLLRRVEKGTKGRICHATYRYAKANNKYIKNYDKNKEASDLKNIRM